MSEMLCEICGLLEDEINGMPVLHLPSDCINGLKFENSEKNQIIADLQKRLDEVEKELESEKFKHDLDHKLADNWQTHVAALKADKTTWQEKVMEARELVRELRGTHGDLCNLGTCDLKARAGKFVEAVDALTVLPDEKGSEKDMTEKEIEALPEI